MTREWQLLVEPARFVLLHDLLEDSHFPSAGAVAELLEVEFETFDRVATMRGIHACGWQQQANFYVTAAHGAVFTARYSPLPTGTRQVVN
jgi:hypothetical protein